MVNLFGISKSSSKVITLSRVLIIFRPVNSTMTNDTDYLLPFYLNYLGGEWLNATQCMEAGSNGYEENHLAYNHGLNDHWALNNTPWSWGYYQRSDLPVQFALAEGWTVADMYQESVIASSKSPGYRGRRHDK